MSVATAGCGGAPLMSEDTARSAAQIIIDDVEANHDCRIVMRGLSESLLPEHDHYFANVRFTGPDCEPAREALRSQGRERGIRFGELIEINPPAESVTPTHQDLIHEIDPDVER